jgi:Flp pilus assembly protein TadD
MAKQKQQGKARPQQPIAAQPTIDKATPVLQSSEAAQVPVKWFMIVLAALVVAVNLPTLNYEYTLDDPFFTTSHPNVMLGLSAIKEFFTHAAYYGVFAHHDASYRPFMLASFALEKDIFGEFTPRISHLINLMLFAAEVSVLFQLLRRMFHKASPYIPFFMVLLFALHPIHTEVVASVKSRDEIMGLLFSALTLLQTLRYVDSGKTKDLLLMALCFFSALMSKETPIALVLIAPMTVYFFREVTMKQIIRVMMPYAAVAVVYLIMRSMFIESDGEKVVIMVNNNALMGTTNQAERIATALWIQLKYLILLVFPHPLSYDYSYNQVPIIGFSSPKSLAALAVIVALFVYAVRGFKKKDVLAYCILFYGMSVIITANLIVIIGATMAERFVFSGSLGFCIAVVWLAAKLLKTDIAGATLANARSLFAVLAVIGVLYGAKTMARNEVWRSNLALYESGMETAPNSWRAQYLLGVEYTRIMDKEKDAGARKEIYKKADAAFEKSLMILPSNSDVYMMKGYADEFAMEYDSAIISYSRTLRLDSLNKQAAINLGSLQMRKGMLDASIQTLGRVLARDSANVDALTNLGASLGNKGLFPQSIYLYEKAYRIKAEQPANVFMSMSNVYRFLADSANAQKYRQLMFKALAQPGAE